jgi:hypothetical protein
LLQVQAAIVARVQFEYAGQAGRLEHVDGMCSGCGTDAERVRCRGCRAEREGELGGAGDAVDLSAQESGCFVGRCRSVGFC